MSARYLKKVLQEQERERKSAINTDSELQHDDDSSDDGESAPPARNPFELLDDQDDELEIADEDSAADAVEQDSARLKSTVAAPPPSSRKSKKKKKKTKEDTKSTKNKSSQSIDEVLESLAIDDSKSFSQNASSSNVNEKNTGISSNLVKPQSSSILSVESKYLRPENELRRIFGSDVVRSFENSNGGGNSRQVRGGRRAVHIPRKTFLVSPSTHWPRWDGSLSMELVETRHGQYFFKYVHTSTYSEAQRAFEAAKAINDVNGIASILVYYPYHIESLITISEVLKFTGEHQASADAISKCLYALECAWHPMFTPFNGNCQLKHHHDTNKPLFTVLFTHMQNMDRRGCHRSALEVCKLLLSLDSDDPKGAMFCVDYYSLRAEEYTWLERFSEEYKTDNSLWLFPNFSYSLAICRYYLERKSTTPEDDEKSSATDLMKQALMLHPLVLRKLVDKAPLKDPAWGMILKHKFFGSAKAGGPSLEHLIEIYVERSYIMWRLPELQAMLRDAAQRVIDTLDRDGREAKNWACVRTETFSSDKNEYSHLLVSDFSGVIPTMPPEEMRNLMVDPRMAEAMGNGEHVGGNLDEVVARVPRDVANRNPFAVFLESLLPWNDFRGGLGDDDNRDDEDED